jgi:hypothetical protein
MDRDLARTRLDVHAKRHDGHGERVVQAFGDDLEALHGLHEGCCEPAILARRPRAPHGRDAARAMAEKRNRSAGIAISDTHGAA